MVMILPCIMTDKHLLGNHDILHRAKLHSVSGKEITSKDAQIAALYLSYLVLSDGKPASWDNRHGLAIQWIDGFRAKR